MTYCLRFMQLFPLLLNPSRNIFFHFSFIFILFHSFSKFIYLFLFSYNCLHFLPFSNPYLLTVHWQHEIGLSGNTDTTENCKCYKSRIFQFHRASCEIPPHRYLHPNIFKSRSLLHFLSVVFNLVGVRTRARLFKKRQLCVF